MSVFGPHVTSDTLLVDTLEVAVPLWIDEFRQLDYDHLLEAAPVCVAAIAEHGDDLLFGGQHCADTFNKLAKAIAIGSYNPGGIAFLGRHWESVPR